VQSTGGINSGAFMSRSGPVTYGDLTALLQELGFRDESVERSHQAFQHPASETLILLSPLTPDSPIRKEDLIAVRRQLDSKGLMHAATFDRRFSQPTPTEPNP
jgi:hypothetical protein